MSAAAEVELKINVPPHVNAGQARQALAWLQIQPAPGQVHTDTYYDTADWRLFRSGVALRIRAHATRQELTLKTFDRGAGSVSNRLKLTQELPALEVGQEPDWSAGGAVLERVGPILQDAAPAPLFLVENRRSRALHASSGHEMEVVLDEVRFCLPGRAGPEAQDCSATHLEIELELLQADSPLAVLEEVAGKIQFPPPVATDETPAEEPHSKFQRGCRYAELTPPEAPPKTAYRVQPDMSLAQLAREVLRVQLAVVEYNEPGAMVGLEVECLHDLRVALRRMRTALRVFQTVLPLQSTQAIQRDLKWLTNITGTYRDLDVSIHDLPRHAAAMTDTGDHFLQVYGRELGAAQARARAELCRALGTRRHATLKDRVRRLAEQAAPPSASPRVLELTALGLLEHGFRRLNKKLRRARKSKEDEPYHDLRKELKRYRYANEFFAGLLEKKQQKRHLGRMTRLQDLMGEFQDCVTAVELLQGYSTRLPLNDRRSRATLVAVGRLIAGFEQRARKLKKKSRKTMRAFTGKGPRFRVKNSWHQA